MRASGWRVAPCVLAFSWALGCNNSAPAGNGAPSASAATPSSSAQSTDAPASYPKGRWRILTYDELGRVVVWVSHILIRHEQSEPAENLFGALVLSNGPAPSTRSRNAALAQAQLIAERAQGDPAEFEQLARQYSEDRVTRDAGGSLGGVKATQLPESFVDALSTMKPGEVSKVVESEYGYHVLKRRPVPAPQQVAGSHIVIAYDTRLRRPGQKPVQRSRQQALERARAVVAEARASKRPFESLATEYSDARDARQRGDFGVWSVRDPENVGRELELLGSLKVGEISEPMDSRWGFEVFERTALDERKSYAMTAIRLEYERDATSPNAPTKAKIEKLARQLVKKLKKDPASFSALQKAHCCVDRTDRFTAGRGPLGMSEVLDGLDFGQIAQEAVDDELFLVIPKRLDPKLVPAPPGPLYEFPTREGPDFERIIRINSGASVANYVRSLRSEAAAALGLTEPQKSAFDAVLERLAAGLAANDDADSRVQIARLTGQELRTLLGTEGFSAFQRFLNEWGTNRVMETR